MRYTLPIFLAISATSAHAQSVYKFDADTIDSSIKCELATVARQLSNARIPASRLLASVEIEGSETTNTTVGAGFTFPWPFLPSFNTSYTQNVVQLRGAKGTRNINTKNNINCRKSFVVDVGIVSCFREQRTLFVEGNTITCEAKTIATAAADAKGQFSIWAVNVGPTGSLSRTRVWKVSIAAPPDKK